MHLCNQIKLVLAMLPAELSRSLIDLGSCALGESNLVLRGHPVKVFKKPGTRDY